MKLLLLKEYPFTLTKCILVDSSTVICWMSPFVILGVSSLFCHFYSILLANNVESDQMPHLCGF